MTSRPSPSPYPPAGPRPVPDADRATVDAEPTPSVQADLARLTGVRSGKRSYYREYVRSDERMQRAVRAMDSISRALVRTVEGPRGLLEEVTRAAAAHLHADWTVLALADGVLVQARPRFLVVDATGRVLDDELLLPHHVRRELGAVRAGLGRRPGDATGWVRVPMTLEDRQVGMLAGRHGLDADPEPGDLSVLRILANQAAVSLHTSEQYQVGAALSRRAQQLYDEATAQARDLASRTRDLQQAEHRLVAATQRELLDGERHRIARELHDSVTQYVLSAGMSLEVARGEAADRGPEFAAMAARLDEAKELTRRAVEQLRSAIYALHHEHGRDDVIGLPDLLHEVAEQHRAHLRVDVRVEGTATPMGSEAEHQLARVAGEALFNTAIHASAKRAVVRLRYGPDTLFMSVADDGCGDPARLRQLLRVERTASADGRHRGLVNMATRAEQLGGTLTLRRARLGGVRVEVRVPTVAGAGTGGAA